MLITRAEFARLCEVSKNWVGQWLDEGKIGGDAVVGTGRDLRIDDDKARAQLRKRRDPGQTLGNGAKTKVRPPRLPPAADRAPDDVGTASNGTARPRTVRTRARSPTVSRNRSRWSAWPTGKGKTG